MAKMIFEEAKEILNEPIEGHPSRNLEQRVARLEKALSEVIRECTNTACRC